MQKEKEFKVPRLSDFKIEGKDALWMTPEMAVEYLFFFLCVCVWVFCFHKAVGYLILFWAFPLRVSFPLENALASAVVKCFSEDEIFEMWTSGCLQLHSSSHVSCGILSYGDHKPLSQLEWDRD